MFSDPGAARRDSAGVDNQRMRAGGSGDRVQCHRMASARLARLPVQLYAMPAVTVPSTVVV